MKAAFSVWSNRIAPVFDAARYIHLVEADSGRILAETRESLMEEMTARKVMRLAELGVGTLVCGAISRPTQILVADYGIQIIPFVAGGLREIIQNWLDNGLDGDVFAMPGCDGNGRKH